MCVRVSVSVCVWACVSRVLYMVAYGVSALSSNACGDPDAATVIQLKNWLRRQGCLVGQRVNLVVRVKQEAVKYWASGPTVCVCVCCVCLLIDWWLHVQSTEQGNKRRKLVCTRIYVLRVFVVCVARTLSSITQ